MAMITKDPVFRARARWIALVLFVAALVFLFSSFTGIWK